LGRGVEARLFETPSQPPPPPHLLGHEMHTCTSVLGGRLAAITSFTNVTIQLTGPARPRRALGGHGTTAAAPDTTTSSHLPRTRELNREAHLLSHCLQTRATCCTTAGALALDTLCGHGVCSRLESAGGVFAEGADLPHPRPTSAPTGTRCGKTGEDDTSRRAWP
jgi:hypothetical protein